MMNIVCTRQHSGKNLEAVFWAFKLVQMFTEPRIFQNMPESGDVSWRDEGNILRDSIRFVIFVKRTTQTHMFFSGSTNTIFSVSYTHLTLPTTPYV